MLCAPVNRSLGDPAYVSPNLKVVKIQNIKTLNNNISISKLEIFSTANFWVVRRADRLKLIKSSDFLSPSYLEGQKFKTSTGITVYRNSVKVASGLCY
jgi:hypothetical protein